MITITKERAQEIFLGNGPEPTASEERELARIALASLEAEPVAYTDAEELRFPHATSDMWRAPLGHGWDLPLYTAPPAPVSLPDESAVELLATDLMKRIDKITGERHSVAMLSSLRVSIVEACCAAMLQGADGNSPVNQDGWVDCSERMPSPSTGVIVAAPWQSAPGGYAMKWATNCPGHPDADTDGWIIPGASWSPTHWMPLPTAPRQRG